MGETVSGNELAASLRVAAEAFERDVLGLDEAAVRCPYGHYADLRAHGPVAELPTAGFLVVTGHSAISDVLRDPYVFSNSSPSGPQPTNIGRNMETALEQNPDLAERLRDIQLRSGAATEREQLGMAAAGQSEGAMSAGNVPLSAPVLQGADPPAHTRHRALAGKGLTVRRVALLEDKIRGWCDELLDGFIGDGRVDFISQFSTLLPLGVIVDLLGFPREMMPTFHRWAVDQLAAVGSNLSVDECRRVLESQMEFWTYFYDQIEERRATPRDDAISDMVNADTEGEEPLSTRELIFMSQQLLAAGHETVAKALAAAMLMLLEMPDVHDAIRLDPKLIPNFVEEVLRLEAPVQGLSRVATTDTEVCGEPVPETSFLWLLYAAGNRDPEAFPNPDELDLGRPNSRSHLSFGGGPHYCIGAPLARLELRVALERILARLDNIRLAEGAELKYIPNYLMHGLVELPLRFDAQHD